MEQRLTFITLGVHNLPAMHDFYCNVFGWQPMMDSEGVSFFKLNGVVLSLFPHHELQKDINLPAGDVLNNPYKGMTLAYNVRTEQEVDEVVAQLQAKGVTVLKAPAKVFWGGYHAYVADIEGNIWEIACNPFLEMDALGNVQGHR